MFELASRLIAQFYSLTHNYALAIGLVAVVVMLLITPLTLKSTRGMLEMQKLQPEMRRLQAEFKGDRQKLNEAMMKLYQGHKVNPLASCLPILAQMPVFIIMFQSLQGLIHRPDGAGTAFVPKYLNETSELYNSLLGKTEMISFGLDLSQTPIDAVNQGFGKGMIYVGHPGQINAVFTSGFCCFSAFPTNWFDLLLHGSSNHSHYSTVLHHQTFLWK
jgi:YidC/Oxa1 family membrane protein insertase